MKIRTNNQRGFGRILGMAVLGTLGLSLGACESSISTVGNPDFTLPSGRTAFYSPAVETTPVIVATESADTLRAGKLQDVPMPWEGSNPVWEVFNVFQEYQFPRDEGVIDVSNIYKLLFEAGNAYDQAVGEVVELETPTEIASPFDFGNEPRTYTHASDDAAVVREGETVHAILNWIWDESPKMSYGVIEGSFHETTGDLAIDMAYLVDYPDEADYCLRTSISGNEATHQFTLRAAKFVNEAEHYAVSMIGTGISQSESEEDYFLIKIDDTVSLSEGPRYFRFSASADEDELRAHPTDGYSLEEVVDPNGYAATIEAMTFFALDGSDHATTAADFASDFFSLR